MDTGFDQPPPEIDRHRLLLKVEGQNIYWTPPEITQLQTLINKIDETKIKIPFSLLDLVDDLDKKTKGLQNPGKVELELHREAVSEVFDCIFDVMASTNPSVVLSQDQLSLPERLKNNPKLAQQTLTAFYALIQKKLLSLPPSPDQKPHHLEDHHLNLLIDLTETDSTHNRGLIRLSSIPRPLKIHPALPGSG